MPARLKNAFVFLLLSLTITFAKNAQASGQAYLRIESRSDLDLHGYFPWGTHVCYWAPTGTPANKTRGEYLSHDANVGGGHPGAIENIYFPCTHPGKYTFRIHNYYDWEHGANPFVFRVSLGGITFDRSAILGGTGDSRTYTFLKSATQNHNNPLQGPDWQSIDSPARRAQHLLPTEKNYQMHRGGRKTSLPPTHRLPPGINPSPAEVRRNARRMIQTNSYNAYNAYMTPFYANHYSTGGKWQRSLLSDLSYVSHKATKYVSRRIQEMHLKESAGGFRYGLKGGHDVVVNELSFGLTDKYGLTHAEYFENQGGAFTYAEVSADVGLCALAAATGVGAAQMLGGISITDMVVNTTHTLGPAAISKTAEYISRMPPPARQRLLSSLESTKPIIRRAQEMVSDIHVNSVCYSGQIVNWLTNSPSGAVVSGIGESVATPPGTPGMPSSYPVIKTASEIVSDITLRQLDNQQTSFSNKNNQKND